MRPDPVEEGRRWLRQVRQDIDDAEYSQAGGRYHLACFLAQQAGEKALRQARRIIRQVAEFLEHGGPA